MQSPFALVPPTNANRVPSYLAGAGIAGNGTGVYPGPPGGRVPGMSDADVAEILKLPVEERLRLVELIWASIAAEPSAVLLSDAERAIIDECLEEHERSPDDVITRELTVLHIARDSELRPGPSGKTR
jgi:putative addiction module component (TIGR02574 family)